MAFHYSDCDLGDGAIHRPGGRVGPAALELAATVLIRMEADFLLAGVSAAGPMPDPVRGPWYSALRARYTAASPREGQAANRRAVGADDPRRARKGQEEILGTLRAI